MSEVNCCDPTVDTCAWESYQPENQPYTYQRVARRKTVAEVYEELKDALGRDEHGFVSLPGVDEYLSVGPEYTYRRDPQTGGGRRRPPRLRVLDRADR